MIEKENFCEIKKETREIFLPFYNQNEFGDTTFSLFYAWKDEFHYVYREFGNVIVILEKNRNGKISCIFLKKDTNLAPVFWEIYQIFQKNNIPFCIKYVSQEELNLYMQTLKEIGLYANYFYDKADSDYIYKTKDFLLLDGKENKGKRGKLNWFYRNYSEVKLIFYEDGKNNLKEDCKKIFESWCKWHRCENCVYGCEKKAFLSFLEVFDVKYHKMAVSYWKEEPLSFAISEKINSETISYFFQKNSKKIRGLTYWLNREMALQHQEVTYINLGEDMGMQGIRMDKTNLHPYELKKKFLIEVR